MKKYIAKISLLVLSALMAFSICACQTDFSKPADYTLDVNGGENIFIPALSAIKNSGDSQTVVFEITNDGDMETDYTISVSSLGILPLVFELESEQAEAEAEGANASGTILDGAKHRYTLTVSWPVEENSYIYAGRNDAVRVTLNAVK